MVTTIRTSFDRHEMRRDQRYVLPPMCVGFADGEYETVNWSLSGFLLSGGPAVEIGGHAAVTVRVASHDRIFEVTAEAVRHDPDVGGVAFRYVDPAEEMVELLDHVIASRMFGRPPK